MDARPSRLRIIGAILLKDLRAIFRDRFWVFMTLLMLAWWLVIFYLLPETIDESITIGVHHSGMDAAIAEIFEEEEEGVDWVEFESSEALEDALGIGTEESQETRSWAEIFLGRGEDEVEPPQIGIDFPADFLTKIRAGENTTVRVWLDPAVPEEIREAMSSMVREIGYELSGNSLPVTEPDQETVVLGVDRSGDQVPFRKKLLPLIAFGMLIMETLALGSLIAEEVSSRSVTAVLATPATVSDFLAAKGIAGTLIAFTEVSVVMYLVDAFENEPLALLTTLFLGAVLVAGTALLVGAWGRDLIETVFLGIALIIPLMVPAIAALFPGSASAWVRILPTYGLVEAITGLTSYGYDWGDILSHQAALAAWCGLVFLIGLIVLKRKVESL